MLFARAPSASVCPDAAELRTRVAERLGYDPFRGDAEPSIRVVFSGASERLVAEIEAYDARSTLLGRRALSSTDESCRELADSAVLTITILLDAPAGAPPRPPPAGAKPPPRPPEVAPPAGDSERPRVTARLMAGSLVGLGFAPSPSFGLTLAAGLRRGAWSAWLGGRIDVPAEGRFEAATARTSVRLAELAGCGHRGLLFLCLLVGAGAITADGGEVLNPRHTLGPFAHAGARVGAEVSLWGPLALRGWADGVAMMVRTSVLVGEREIWTSPAVGGVFGVGLVGRFP